MIIIIIIHQSYDTGSNFLGGGITLLNMLTWSSLILKDRRSDSGPPVTSPK